MHCQQQSGSKPGWPQATPAGLRPMQQQAYQQDQASPYSNDAYGYGFLYPPPLRERQHNHLAPGQPNTWPSARHSAPAPAPAPYQADWNYSFNSTNLQQQHIAPAQFDNSFTGNSVQAGFIAGYGGNSIVGPSEPEPHPDADRLKAVKDLPAAFHPIFSYRYFNPVQSECFDTALGSDINMVVSAPTGAGKTGVMELAMVRLLSKHLKPAGAQQQLQQLQGSHKIVYLGPIKALVQERQQDWQARYGTTLGLKVLQLSGDAGDSDELEADLEAADIICATPEKFDQVTRKITEKGSLGFFAEIGLVLLDEVHLLNESGRGSSLEAGCVCRIKAVAAFPQMAQAPIASARFVAVSATIPNIHDIAHWLSVPPEGLRQFGEELRPCKLTTHVKGYAPAKNDFLFERRLNDHVFNVVSDFSKGRPALVFCSSRKGTTEAAAALAKGAEARAPVTPFTAAAAGPGGALPSSSFVRTPQQQQRLRAAAAQAHAKALAAVLVAGVGFHNAAMEPPDRELVEGLFKAGDLAVLCTTSTLAMGVNLPAHLVVLKGTVRWVGDSDVLPGEPSGYKEYSQTEVLQMVGRAGRPQFDTEGVAVIMTSRESTCLYQRLLAGQVVESCLLANLPEHLNAEIVLGSIADVSQAIAWIKSTFLFTRVRANPRHYGLKLKPGIGEAELDALLRDQLLMQQVAELMKYQLIESDEDSYSLKATAAGKLMAAHFLKLKTMASIVQLGKRPNMPSLLRVICGAEEFKNTGLRRSEKKILNELNHSKEAEQLRFHVMSDKDSSKVKERIGTPAEKLFILLNDGLADKPADSLDYSMRQEQDRLLVVGNRIAKCMAKYYALRGSFSAAGRSLLLARSLKARLWEDSAATVRQLPSVGRLLGARLAAAGLGSLQAVAACGDGHRLEVAAQKPYPWGSELLAALKAVSPPAVTITLQLLGPLPGRGKGYNCQVTLTKEPSGTAPAAAAAAAGAARAAAGSGVSSMGNGAEGGVGSSRTFTPCKLLVGCSGTDELVLLRNLVVERFEPTLQLQFRVNTPPGLSHQPLQVTAMLIHERLVGFDHKASITLGPQHLQQHLQQQQQQQQQPQQGQASSSAARASHSSSLSDPAAEAVMAQHNSRCMDSMHASMDAGQSADVYTPGMGAAAAVLGDECMDEDGSGGQEGSRRLDAAAEGYQVLQRKQQQQQQQQRSKRARASWADDGSAGTGVPGANLGAAAGAFDGMSEAAAAATKKARGLCWQIGLGAGVSAAAAVAAAAGGGDSRGLAAGAAAEATRQSQLSKEQLGSMAQGMAGSPAVPAGAATAGGMSILGASVAARYRSAFTAQALGAKQAPDAAQQQAAMDAAELQVTPGSHQSQQGQVQTRRTCVQHQDTQQQQQQHMQEDEAAGAGGAAVAPSGADTQHGAAGLPALWAPGGMGGNITCLLDLLADDDADTDDDAHDCTGPNKQRQQEQQGQPATKLAASGLPGVGSFSIAAILQRQELPSQQQAQEQQQQQQPQEMHQRSSQVRLQDVAQKQQPALTCSGAADTQTDPVVKVNAGGVAGADGGAGTSKLSGLLPHQQAASAAFGAAVLRSRHASSSLNSSRCLEPMLQGCLSSSALSLCSNAAAAAAAGSPGGAAASYVSAHRVSGGVAGAPPTVAMSWGSARGGAPNMLEQQQQQLLPQRSNVWQGQPDEAGAAAAGSAAPAAHGSSQGGPEQSMVTPPRQVLKAFYPQPDQAASEERDAACSSVQSAATAAAMWRHPHAAAAAAGGRLGPARSIGNRPQATGQLLSDLRSFAFAAPGAPAPPAPQAAAFKAAAFKPSRDAMMFGHLAHPAAATERAEAQAKLLQRPGSGFTSGSNCSIRAFPSRGTLELQELASKWQQQQQQQTSGRENRASRGQQHSQQLPPASVAWGSFVDRQPHSQQLLVPKAAVRPVWQGNTAGMAHVLVNPLHGGGVTGGHGDCGSLTAGPAGSQCDGMAASFAHEQQGQVAPSVGQAPPQQMQAPPAAAHVNVNTATDADVGDDLEIASIFAFMR